MRTRRLLSMSEGEEGEEGEEREEREEREFVALSEVEGHVPRYAVRPVFNSPQTDIDIFPPSSLSSLLPFLLLKPSRLHFVAREFQVYLDTRFDGRVVW